MPGPWFLYLDESGDLGLDPDKQGRSRYFTICILAVSTTTRNRAPGPGGAQDHQAAA
jgi:hypothetical protein